jgi:hypothetical protein
MAKRLLLKNVRISFPNLFSPARFQNKADQPLQYRVTALYPKDSPIVAQVRDAALAVAQEKWPQDYKMHLAAAKEASNKRAWADGDTKAYNGYAGNEALTCIRDAERDGAPLLVDRDGKTPLASGCGKLYGGCYANIIVDIYAQSNKEGKAIRCGLVTVQFVKDGESFGGASAPTTDGLEDLGVDPDSMGSIEDMF